MGNKIRIVQKLRQSEAIQINSPEEEETVRSWLAGMGVEDQAGLEELKRQRFWFLRDEGDNVVYVVSDADFSSYYETVDTAPLPETVTPVTTHGDDLLSSFIFPTGK